jgi:hypothetical protein
MPPDSTVPASTPLDPQSLQDYTTALEQLHDLLDDAYWSATTIEAKDAINDLSQSIFEILTTLEQQAIQTATPEYIALKSTVDAVNANLQVFQGKVNGWIQKIDIANKVLSAIAQAVAQAGKVFAIL